MSWKCICGEINNPDGSKFCKNCGREKPKYLGIQLEIDQKQTHLTNQQKAVLYLMIAYDYLLESDRDIEKDRGVTTDYDHHRNDAKRNCSKCLKLLRKSQELFPEAQFKNANGIILDIPSIQSQCYFNMGSVSFKERNFEKAIEYFKESYDSDPNQVSIYNIAMATINLPVEGGGLFGGKKKEAAKEAKREQEIELLKKTIKFAPFSELGIKSAKILMEDYGLADINI